MQSPKKTLASVHFCLVLSICFSAAAQDKSVFQKWNKPIEPFRIIGHIYYVGANELAAYLITTPGGHILLDGGLPETAPIILRSIDKLGFAISDVKILLNSHAHFDHAGGLAELKRRSGATLMVMAGDVETIETGGEDLGPDFVFPAAKVDSVLHDKAQITLGGTKLTAHHTPGHSKGCTTWTMQVEKAGQKYNVVFAGSPNVLPEIPLVANAEYPEIAEDFKKTFSVLKNLPCDVFLSAHGSMFLLEKKAKLLADGHSPNPFIDTNLYRRFVASKEKIFWERLARAQKEPRN